MLNFNLTLEEANAVLAALSKAPYEQVVTIIDKMQKQAREQIDDAVEKTSGGTD
jgi:hypothetical protein